MCVIVKKLSDSRWVGRMCTLTAGFGDTLHQWCSGTGTCVHGVYTPFFSPGKKKKKVSVLVSVLYDNNRLIGRSLTQMRVIVPDPFWRGFCIGLLTAAWLWSRIIVSHIIIWHLTARAGRPRSALWTTEPAESPWQICTTRAGDHRDHAGNWQY